MKSAIAIPGNLTSEIVDSFNSLAFVHGKASRLEAMRSFEKLGLPGNKSEEYRFTPITRVLEKNFRPESFCKITGTSLENIEPFLIPDYESNLLIFINGQYNPLFSKIISPGEELVIQNLQDALNEKSTWAQRYFSKLVSAAADPFAALNLALWQSGILIRIPDNQTVRKPIVIHHIHDAAQESVAGFTRLLIVAGENSKVSIVEKSDTTGSFPVFCSLVEEISVNKKAHLNYCKIQNASGAIHQVVNTLIHQGGESQVNTFTITLNGRTIRNNFGIAIDGEACESHFHGLYLTDGQMLADNHTVVDHIKPNSFSNQLYKGILDGNSKGVFNGKIYVRPHAQKTNAFQSNRNILLADSATINTKPQLEIWADDVKCSHGCTTGQLDEDALFYLQSRGISKESAKAMLLYAYAGEVIGPITDTQLKNYLDQAIETKLHHHLIP